MLSLIADQLHALGFRGMSTRSLKPKHIESLIKHWRREEAIKFSPNYADQGDHLRLKESWTKGGKARTVPPRTLDQSDVLDCAHRLAGGGSLIPSDRKYRRQFRMYEAGT